MTQPTSNPNWGGIGRTIKRPFLLKVTNKDGKQAIIRVNDVGPGVAGHADNHMLDLSVAAKNYLGTGGGFTIEPAPAGSSPGPLAAGATLTREQQMAQKLAEQQQQTQDAMQGDSRASQAQLTQPSTPNRGGLTNIVPTTNFEGIGRGKGSVGMTSGRGDRLNPVSGRWKHHAGIDIGTSGQKGWYVAFKLGGVVSDVGTFSGYGKTVIITVGDKDFLFAHLAQILVKKGDKYTGQVIGEIGNTGAGTGEHLHFEVSPVGTGGYGQDEDPMPYTKYLQIGRYDPEGQTPQINAQLSPNQPTQGARSERNINRRGSYDQMYGQGNITPIPIPGQQPSGGGGRSGAPMMSVSTSAVVNSYYKSQLMGFLYKQG